MSLQYVLMTLGPVLVALPWVHGRSIRQPSFLLTFGRVPLFFYVADLWMLHVLGLIAAVLHGMPLGEFKLKTHFGGIPPGFAFPLWATIPFTALTLTLLYPLCRARHAAPVQSPAAPQESRHARA